MLLAVAETPLEAEELRHTYAKLHCFVYVATHKNLLRAVEKYKPNVILLKVSAVTDLLVKKMQKIRKILPDIALITLSDGDVSALSPDLTYSSRVQKRTLQFQGLYFLEHIPQSSLFMGSYMILGLLMVPFDKKVFLCGHRVRFTPEEVFLLRYLAMIHPRRATAEELGSLCFTYGKKAPRSTVASRISRINKKAEQTIFVPIITHLPDEGYGIDF